MTQRISVFIRLLPLLPNNNPSVNLFKFIERMFDIVRFGNFYAFFSQLFTSGHIHLYDRQFPNDSRCALG
jgi:hypothetical protein